jgi:hypothetical protein
VISRLWKSSVFWAFCSTALRLGGFIFVLPFALRRLSPEHLGIWYTMQSLSSLVILMEAGFSPCISRFASFYFAGARKVPSLGLKTEPADHEASPNLSALAGLVLMARRLYRIFGLGALVFMTVGGGGWLAWKFGPIFLRADVFSAYLLYAMGIAVMMSGFFWADLLFGVQQVRESYYNTIAALILNYVVTIVLFKLGCGLLSLAMGQIIMTLLPRWLGRRRFLRLFPIGEVKQPQFIAIKELWPMCWRSGLSAFAAYLLLRNITLVAADVLDLHVTASLGLSLQFSLALAGVSQIWLVVKYPVISALRVKKDEKALRRVVRQRIPLCLAVQKTNKKLYRTAVEVMAPRMGVPRADPDRDAEGRASRHLDSNPGTARDGSAELQSFSTWLIETQRPMLCAWLDALGIEHAENGCADVFPPQPEAAKLKKGVDLLLGQFDPAMVTFTCAASTNRRDAVARPGQDFARRPAAAAEGCGSCKRWRL